MVSRSSKETQKRRMSFQVQIKFKSSLLPHNKIHITSTFTNIKANMVHDKGRNMNIPYEMLACKYNLTNSNHLLKYFVKRKYPVKQWDYETHSGLIITHLCSNDHCSMPDRQPHIFSITEVTYSSPKAFIENPNPPIWCVSSFLP